MKKYIAILIFTLIIGMSFPLFPFFLFVFMNSQGNEIDFDINSSTVTHKEGRKLYRLYLYSDSLDDSYFIKLKAGHEAARRISLTSIDTNYIITDWRDNQLTKIQLCPNSLYKLENYSNGDCGPGIVTFMTDSLGKTSYEIDNEDEEY